jgi:hypothetical protein
MVIEQPYGLEPYKITLNVDQMVGKPCTVTSQYQYLTVLGHEVGSNQELLIKLYNASTDEAQCIYRGERFARITVANGYTLCTRWTHCIPEERPY